MSQEIKGYQKRRCITNINSTFGKQSLDMNVQIDLDTGKMIKRCSSETMQKKHNLEAIVDQDVVL